MPLRVVLIEGDALIRECLAQALETKGFIVEVFAEVSAVLRGVPRGAVIFYHSCLGLRRSPALLEAIRRPDIASRLVVKAEWLNTPDRLLFEKHEVAGIIDGNGGLSELVQAIRTVAGGRHLESRSRSGAARGHSAVELSVQERRAAELAVESLANKEIAARMGVSESYVKGLLQRVYLKVGVSSRMQLSRTWLDGAIADPRGARR